MTTDELNALIEREPKEWIDELANWWNIANSALKHHEKLHTDPNVAWNQIQVIADLARNAFTEKLVRSGTDPVNARSQAIAQVDALLGQAKWRAAEIKQLERNSHIKPKFAKRGTRSQKVCPNSKLFQGNRSRVEPIDYPN